MYLECDATIMQLEQSRAAKAIRDRLKTPPNAVQDRPLSLKRPSRGITGLEARKLAQEAAARAEEVRKQAALDRQKKLAELYALEATKITSWSERDWLIVADINPRANKYPPKYLEHIKQVVANEFKITPVEIDSMRRTKNLFIPRHVAWYLCKQLTPKSYPEIGRAFGGKDHSSLVHAFQKISHRLRADAALCQTVIELQARLELDLERWRAQG